MLMRFDPFRELDQLLRPFESGSRFVGMPLDAWRDGDHFVVEVDLPGVRRDSIELTVERNVLSISAERAAAYQEGDAVLVSERPAGTVTRQLFLGEGLDTDRIEARYEDGVLHVVVPVAEQAKPHRIQISTADSGGQAVEAGSSA